MLASTIRANGDLPRRSDEEERPRDDAARVLTPETHFAIPEHSLHIALRVRHDRCPDGDPDSRYT